MLQTQFSKIAIAMGFTSKDIEDKLHPLPVGKLDPQVAPNGMFVVDHVFCCTWTEKEGGETRQGGTTYAASMEYLESFIEIFKTAIDPVRPLIENVAGKVTLLAVNRELFNEVMTNTSGVVHSNQGFHRFDPRSMV